MNDLKAPKGLTIVAGLLLTLITAISIGLLGGGCPSFIAPGSVLITLPWMLGIPLPLLIFIPAFLFWLWSPNLFRGESILPKRTKILGYATAILSSALFIKGWSYGERFQGMQFTVVCATLSAAYAVASLICGRSNKVNRSFKSNLVTTWLIFAWIFTYAFPYLGEIP